jgi:hypothetical protein
MNNYFIGGYIDADISDILLDNTWQLIAKISVNTESNEILGIVVSEIHRSPLYAHKLNLINFTKKSNYIFRQDVLLFFHELFTKYNVEKVKWNVFVGSRNEKIYDKFINIAGGRVVGIFENDTINLHNVSVDIKYYEISKKDYKLLYIFDTLYKQSKLIDNIFGG